MVIKLEPIFNEAFRLHSMHCSKIKIVKPKLNLCISSKYQLNNYTLSFITHLTSKNTDFYIANSKIHGKGIFAGRFYFPGEPIFSYEGETISIEESNRRENYYKEIGADFYMFKCDPETVIDATFIGNFAKFVNQSCDQNCYSTQAKWGAKTGILICAKKYISVDEEFTYNYGFLDKKMKCNCGLNTCKNK
ncbi:hypothetical protein EDEG_03172 [Edhazardia aedis USNM 41457]|uniref:SET domain-containing protein n=1 Tax=Edhazardia aedis (strain USNM 41457) TaxID=1003232 RepID=J8ZRT2_EDHAE|nr:hypothetical protein EDEG_03172 [Edhazardia aedis USNM 41457]|eukprot:EJW02403.1 hypothetical protein EDEG_03172 [Edhazardia aedis USNM 41457]